MKQWFLTLIGWLFCLTLIAQVPQYRMQYWFDGDYASHITESNITGVWQTQMEVSHLSEGFHTLYLHFQDTSGRWSAPRSYLFYQTKPQNAQHDKDYYSCWFDQDATTPVSGTLNSGTMLLDVDSLPDGFHTLNMQIGNARGTTLRTWLFYKVPQQDYTELALNYSYWFDHDATTPISGTLNSGTMLLDVNGLPDGFHTLNMQIGSGRAAIVRNWLFYKVTKQDETENIPFTWHYSIDDVNYPAFEITPMNEFIHLDLDVMALDSGQHVISYCLTDVHGNVLDMNSASFYHGGSSIIIFQDEDGTVLQRDTLAFGVQPVYRGASPVKQNTVQYTYEFSGWSTGEVSESGEIVYTATYASTLNKYVVTFLDEDGSTVLQRDTLDYGTMPTFRGTTPAKQSTAQYSYSFSGWSPSIVSVEGEATYVANYASVLNKYVVTFVDEDGSTILQRDTLDYGTMPTFRGTTPAKQSTAQYSYSFSGWSPTIVSVESEATYVANYASMLNKYIVTFVDEDGTTVLQRDTLDYGAMPSYRGATPAKQSTAQYSYSFSGWSPTIVSVESEATYVANYTSVLNKYVVTFVDEDGSTILQRDTLDYGAMPSYRGATPVKQSTAQYSYSFSGWSPTIVSIEGEATYVANYALVLNKYVVTFVDEDGTTVLQRDTLDYGTMPTFRGTTPAKQSTAQYSYSFSGWSPTIVSVEGEATYVANYASVLNKYVVTFVDEDGSTVLQRDTLDYGTMPRYRGATPAKASTAQYSYEFAGWTPSLSEVVKDAIYTATYSEALNKYVVLFLNDDSTLLQVDTLEYGAMPVFRDSVPTKEPDSLYTYVFDGWSPEVVEVTETATYIATYRTTATDLPFVPAEQQPRKVLEDGKMYIIMPNGTKYSTTGKKVK